MTSSAPTALVETLRTVTQRDSEKERRVLTDASGYVDPPLESGTALRARPAPTSAASAKSSAPDLTTLIECVWRHRWLCLVAGSVLAVLGATGGWFGIPARYKATALIRLGSPQGLIDKPNESSNAQREFRSTQQELLRMPHVLRRALESPKVASLDEIRGNPDAFELLSSRLELELPRSSEILRVAIQHDRAEIAFVLANAITDAYLEEVHRGDREDVEKRSTTLDKLHAAAEERLGKTWSELKSLARQLGSGDPAALSLQAQAEIENYRAYARRLRELRTQKRESEQLVKSIQDSPELLSKEIPENTSQNSVKFVMFTAKLKKEQALAKWGPNHPDVLVAAGEENLLREYYQKAVTEEEQEPRSRKEELLSEPLAAIARLSHEEQSLESMIKEIEDRLQILGGDNTAKLEIFRNEIGRMEKLSDRLWQTRENLQVESHADNRIQLVSYATLPTKRDTSKRNKLTPVFAGAGFALIMLLVAIGELRTGRLHSLRTAAQRTGLEMLGELAELPEAVSLAELQAIAYGSAQAAVWQSQLDMLAAKLIHHPVANQARTILVTSASTNQERAGLTVCLAATLARTGKKTVALNLDLRNSTACVHLTELSDGGLTEWLDVVPQKVRAAWREEASGCGLTEWLDRSGACEDLKLHDDVPNLYLLPVGTHTAESLTVVTHARLEQLVNYLKQHYDYVILDTAPVVKFPDALHLGRLADVAILSVLKKVSRSASVVQAKDCLEKIGVPVLGTMLQGAKQTSKRVALAA